jgi:hypothetical protein
VGQFLVGGGQKQRLNFSLVVEMIKSVKFKVLAVILAAFLVTVLFPYVQKCGFEGANAKLAANVISLNVNGCVDTLYRDRNAHMTPVISICSKRGRSRLIIPNDKSGLFDYVQVGDSIIKAKGSLQCRVLRDTVVFISIEKYTSTSIQKYTNLVVLQPQVKLSRGTPGKLNLGFVFLRVYASFLVNFFCFL